MYVLITETMSFDAFLDYESSQKYTMTICVSTMYQYLGAAYIFSSLVKPYHYVPFQQEKEVAYKHTD